MEPSTQAPDSKTLSPLSQVKGLTQIALGAAAGAFVASRMSRGALMLTAGLAYALWKQVQSPKAATTTVPASTTETPTVLPVEAFPEVSTLIRQHIISTKPDPTSPATIAPIANAWDDLRAALSPVLAGAVSKTEPLAPLSSDEPTHIVLPESPPMFEMNLCAPSSPLMLPSLHDSADLPDEIKPPSQESEGESPLGVGLLMPDSEPSSQPISLGLTETQIIPKITGESLNPAPVKDSSLTPPVIVPRDAQARKKFFDWLRG